MTIRLKIDDAKIMRVLRRAPLSVNDMLGIEGTGAKVIVNEQRSLVPFDTAATKLSIDSHIEEMSVKKIVDEIGPETHYAPYLEYGTGEFAESGKGRKGGWMYKDEKGWHFTLGMRPRPFVRPSILGNELNIFKAITAGCV